MSTPALGAVDEVYRAEFGRVVASLAARFRDLDLAEEMAQEAFVEAVRRWPTEGVPPNPGGWLTVVARNRALDRLRRESTRQARHEEADMLTAPEDPGAPVTSVVDERLRLLFTCCHPALAPEARVALTLRLLGGLTVPEVADAFLVPERTMAQRITRAKRKIAAANIPYRVPRDHELPERLSGVLAVVYLVFTEGHLPGSGEAAVREDLCAEAIRLGRVLRELMPDEEEVAGLLALMLLTDARREARVDADGVLVTLDQQDRSLWDRTKIVEGHALVRECLRRNRPGHYQLLAAINAVHTDAATAADTKWDQVLALYDRVLVVTPTPVVVLNRAVALAEVEGPEAALAVVDPLADALDGYHPFHATRADLLRRLGRSEEAGRAYDRAVELAGNPAERALLTRRRTALACPAVVDEDDGREAEDAPVAPDPRVAVVGGRAEGDVALLGVPSLLERPVGERSGPRPLVLVPLLEGADVAMGRLPPVLAAEGEEAGEVGELVGGGPERLEGGLGGRDVPDAVAEQDAAAGGQVAAGRRQRPGRPAEDVGDPDREDGVEAAIGPGRRVARDDGAPARRRGLEDLRRHHRVEVDADPREVGSPRQQRGEPGPTTAAEVEDPTVAGWVEALEQPVDRGIGERRRDGVVAVGDAADPVAFHDPTVWWARAARKRVRR